MILNGNLIFISMCCCPESEMIKDFGELALFHSESPHTGIAWVRERPAGAAGSQGAI